VIFLPDEDSDGIIRAKWVMDDALTFSEAAAMLRAYADELVTLEQDGYQLICPVGDDYGFFAKNGVSVMGADA